MNNYSHLLVSELQRLILLHMFPESQSLLTHILLCRARQPTLNFTKQQHNIHLYMYNIHVHLHVYVQHTSTCTTYIYMYMIHVYIQQIPMSICTTMLYWKYNVTCTFSPGFVIIICQHSELSINHADLYIYTICQALS